jgi:short-subunit dehydrogenase
LSYYATQVALITGAGSGVGRALAVGLARRGAEDIEHVMDVNLWGVVHTAKAFLPHVIESGGGHIVNISSGLGLMAAPHYSAYNASKFAVRGFSESLRQEMALDGHPVSVTCVYPGAIKTDIMRNGTFAAGVDASSIMANFDVIAWTETEKAASAILRGVQRQRAQVLVGLDAHIGALVVRVIGTAYQSLLPWIGRQTRRLGRATEPRRQA